METRCNFHTWLAADYNSHPILIIEEAVVLHSQVQKFGDVRTWYQEEILVNSSLEDAQS